MAFDFALFTTGRAGIEGDFQAPALGAGEFTVCAVFAGEKAGSAAEPARGAGRQVPEAARAAAEIADPPPCSEAVFTRTRTCSLALVALKKHLLFPVADGANYALFSGAVPADRLVLAGPVDAGPVAVDAGLYAFSGTDRAFSRLRGQSRSSAVAASLD